MKKLLFSALIALSMVSSAFATDVKKVNYRVASAFNDQYRGATNVQWEMKADFARASFMQDNKKVDVFYNYNGERIGSTSNISIDNLPTSAKRTFAKKYAGYSVTEAIEFESENEVSYFLTAVKDNNSMILQVNGSSISVFKKLN